VTGLSALIYWFGTFTNLNSPYSEKKDIYIFGTLFIIEYILLPAGFFYYIYYKLNGLFSIDVFINGIDYILFALSAIISYIFIEKNYTKIENFGKSIDHFQIRDKDTKIKQPPKLLKRYIYPSIFILVIAIVGTLGSESAGDLRYFLVTSAILILTFMVVSLGAILYGLELTSYYHVKVKMKNRPFEKSGFILKDGDYLRLITNNGIVKINKDVITIIEESDESYRYRIYSEIDKLSKDKKRVDLK
jgi:hypothetical protein